MSTLLEIALSNLLMAAALAVPAVLAGWWGRRPALTHGLWLLVLLKLVTPPIGRVPIAVPQPGGLPEEPAVVEQAFLPAPSPLPPSPWGRGVGVRGQARMPTLQAPAEPARAPEVVLPDPLPDGAPPPPEGLPVAQMPLPLDPDRDPDPDLAAPQESVATAMPGWPFCVGLTWLTGSVIWLALAVGRLVRFQRLLRFAEPAPPALLSEAATLAGAMGMRCPRVLVLPGTISPMLWAMGGQPRVLLPAGLVGRLRPAQQATLLAHELAHWRRGDHRIRLLEVFALALYWWCPFVWWARRQLHQAEEECCDAWVVALLPDAARDYALTLVETIDFLSGAPQTLPPVASGVGHVRLLQRRLTMILRGATPQSLTRGGLVLLAGLGLVLLPFIPTLAQQPGDAQPVNRQRALEFLQTQSRKQAEDESARALLRLAELAQTGQVPLDRVQRELEEQRAHLQKQLEQLHQAVEQLKQAAKAAAKKQPAGPMGGGGMPKMAGGMAGGRGGGMAPRGMAGGMGGGMPPGMVGPGGMGGSTTKGGSVEQRLEQVERKLDILLWEIANLRRDMAKGRAAMGMPPGPGGPMGPGMPTGPGGGMGLPGMPGSPFGRAGGGAPQGPPGAGPNFAPPGAGVPSGIPGGGNFPRVPAGGGGGFSGGPPAPGSGGRASGGFGGLGGGSGGSTPPVPR